MYPLHRVVIWLSSSRLDVVWPPLISPIAAQDVEFRLKINVCRSLRHFYSLIVSSSKPMWSLLTPCSRHIQYTPLERI
jgi:hypothetical protein